MENMNIQNAFQLAKNRKRKLDAAVVTPEAKARKTDDDNVEVHLSADEKLTKPSESKTDHNNCSISSEQINNNDNVHFEGIAVDADSSKPDCTNTSGEDSVTILSSQNDQGSSELGSSMNKSMESSANTTVEDNNTPKVVAKSGPVSNVLKQSLPKKQRRMSPQEAKRRTELRAEKEKLKERQRQEALAKKQEEKNKREKEKMQAKLEKQQKKEEEDRERERIKQEKKLQEEREKQEKLQERLKLKSLIQEAKAEVKKQKEQQKMKALEDKLKALEEKKKIEEEKTKLELEKEKKKAKTKQAFESFFVKSGTSALTSSPHVQGKERTFLPFQVSDDMVLAPIIPIVAKKRFDKEQLDFHLNNKGSGILYLEALKSDDHKCVRYSKAKKDPKPTIDCEVIGTEVEPVHLDLKPKLLQFDENIRPPYWGTFRKNSTIVSGRRPFATEDMFDYDVDSDDEWDEGGPGESLNGTEDDESEDDYEVDNEFFVPHGYLSAEEEGEEDVEEGEEIPKDQEAYQARLKMKEKEFLSVHDKKTTQLKPVIVGTFFINRTVDQNDFLIAFQAFEAEDVRTVVKLQVPDGLCTPSPGEFNLTRTSSNLKRAVPEEALPFLLRLLHANTNGRQKVIKEFQNFWMLHCKKTEDIPLDPDSKDNKAAILDVNGITPDTQLTPNARGFKISKRQLDRSISTVAVWGKPASQVIKKHCWWVKDEFLHKYELTDLPIPNQWTYTLPKDVEDHTPEQVLNHPN